MHCSKCYWCCILTLRYERKCNAVLQFRGHVTQLTIFQPARDYHTKNWLLGQNIQIFGSKKHIFAPSGQMEPHRSMFSTWKRCLIGIPIRGYQNFYSLPPKNWILGPKTAKYGPKLAFWAKYRHFWPIWSNAWPKNNADKLSRWFSVMFVPKILLPAPKKLDFGPKNGQIWPKTGIFGQISAFLAHLIYCLTKKQCRQVV